MIVYCKCFRAVRNAAFFFIAWQNLKINPGKGKEYNGAHDYVHL